MYICRFMYRAALISGSLYYPLNNIFFLFTSTVPDFKCWHRSVFFCHLKEHKKVKPETFTKKLFREKASPSRNISTIFKNKKQDFWLAVGLLTTVKLTLPSSWPLRPCCLSPGWRAWEQEEQREWDGKSPEHHLCH